MSWRRLEWACKSGRRGVMPRVNIDLIYMPSVRAPFTQVCPSQTLTLHPFPPPLFLPQV